MEAKITAIGAYAPEKVIDNHYFESFLETSTNGYRAEPASSNDGFRGKRIHQRLSIAAVRNLPHDATMGAISDVDFILVATVTHDQIMPSMGAQLNIA